MQDAIIGVIAAILAAIIMILIIAAVIIFPLGIWCIFVYNKVIPLNEGCKNSEANLHAEQNRKLDLYVTIADVLSQSSEFERSVYTSVARVRTNSDLPIDEKLVQAQSLLAVSESNPDLKSTEIFRQFQSQVSETENRIQAAKEARNLAINNYNVVVLQFPFNIACYLLKFKPHTY